VSPQRDTELLLNKPRLRQGLPAYGGAGGDQGYGGLALGQAESVMGEQSTDGLFRSQTEGQAEGDMCELLTGGVRRCGARVSVLLQPLAAAHPARKCGKRASDGSRPAVDSDACPASPPTDAPPAPPRFSRRL
jgi:hypothetical protein